MVNAPRRKAGLGKRIIAYFALADIHGERVFLDSDEQIRGIVCGHFIFHAMHWGLQFATILQILTFFINYFVFTSIFVDIIRTFPESRSYWKETRNGVLPT